MNSYEVTLKLSELFKEISDLKSILQNVSKKVNSDEILWDNSDLIRNWKISERTLADWRSKNLISYVQLNGKIWYTRHAREEFVNDNTILSKGRRAEL